MDERIFSISIAAQGRTLVDIQRFGFEEGCVTFLFGESGIGKSLIAKSLYGLLDPSELRATINGERYGAHLSSPWCREVRRTGFFVFQEPSSHLNPLLTLRAQLQEGSLANSPTEKEILGDLWDHAPERELDDLLSVYPKPYRPSGGEKQRMLLAMAFKKIDLSIAAGPAGPGPFCVFDEPTGSLDNHFRDRFLDMLFERYRRMPFTVLLITHDYSMVGKVTSSYGSLAAGIRMRELALVERGLVEREFLPETYNGWIRSQRPASPGVQDISPLLVVESGAEIFGRQLIISRDPEGREVVPLFIPRGRMVYLKAPSGTGKTSLVKMIMGLYRGTRLRVTLDGMNLTEKTGRRFFQKRIWGRKLTMVFQHADEALNPRSTVRETFRGLPVRGRVTDRQIVGALETLFGEGVSRRFLTKRVSTLSGGQKQRLNLLRGLFLDTQLLILDEPLNGLDFESSMNVLGMLRRKLEEGKSLLLISHNEEIFDTQVPPEHVYFLHARRIPSRP